MRRRATATAWNPNADGFVHALAVSGSTVYAGGCFSSDRRREPQQHRRARCADGQGDRLEPRTRTAQCARWRSRARPCMPAGTSAAIGGESRNNIAALDAQTGKATAWNPNADNSVSALAVSGSTVYAGGWFASVGGRARRTSPRSTRRQARRPPGTRTPTALRAIALAVSGSTVYAGGASASRRREPQQHRRPRRADRQGDRLEPERRRRRARARGLGLDRLRRRAVHQHRRRGAPRHRRARRHDRPRGAPRPTRCSERNEVAHAPRDARAQDVLGRERPGAGAEARPGVGARADVVEARDGRAVARKAG